MTFRFAVPEDAPAILDIYAPYIRETVITFEYEVPTVEAFTERVKGITEKYPYLVCEEDGVLLGYAYAGEYRSRTAFQWDVELSIYLRPEAQGKGIARAFYDRLLPMVEKLGYRNIYSSIVTPNPASIGLQEKYGFETLCVFEKCGYKLGQWCDLLWMHKKIGDWSKGPVTPVSISEMREELEKLLDPPSDDSTLSISSVDRMNGHDFKHFCAYLMEENGFSNVRATKVTDDHGVDILAEKDSIRYAIRCENNSSPLGSAPLQEVHAGKTFYNYHVGVVMTNSTFTSEAKELAAEIGVLMWDREKIIQMISHAKEDLPPSSASDSTYQQKDNDENLLFEIQNSIDAYIDTATQFWDECEQLDEDVTDGDTLVSDAVVLFGKYCLKSAKKLRETTVRIKNLYLALFDSLRSQGLNGWSDDYQSTVIVTEKLIQVQEQLMNIFVRHGEIIQTALQSYHMEYDVYVNIRCQALKDIDEGKHFLQSTEGNLRSILAEYNKFKGYT